MSPQQTADHEQRRHHVSPTPASSRSHTRGDKICCGLLICGVLRKFVRELLHRRPQDWDFLLPQMDGSSPCGSPSRCLTWHSDWSLCVFRGISVKTGTESKCKARCVRSLGQMAPLEDVLCKVLRHTHCLSFPFCPPFTSFLLRNSGCIPVCLHNEMSQSPS